MRVEIVLTKGELLELVEGYIRSVNPNGVYIGNGQVLTCPDLEQGEYRVIIGE